MNLCIDIGNSNIKFATYDGNKLVEFKAIENTPSKFNQIISNEINENQYENICMISVVEHFISEVKANFPQIKIIENKDFAKFLKMGANNAPSMAAHPELGSDIAIGCYGAIENENDNLVVIDIGTAITVSAIIDGMLESIYIYPGFRISKLSLTSNTDMINVETGFQKKNMRATNTNECIDLGLYFGINGAIKEMVNACSSMFEQPPRVIITGGDHNLIEIEGIEHIPDLVTFGINKYLLNNL